jgi:hypothetical protein
MQKADILAHAYVRSCGLWQPILSLAPPVSVTRRGAGIGGRTRWRSRARATSLNLPSWSIVSTYSGHGSGGGAGPCLRFPR